MGQLIVVVCVGGGRAAPPVRNCAPRDPDKNCADGARQAVLFHEKADRDIPSAYKSSQWLHRREVTVFQA